MMRGIATGLALLLASCTEDASQTTTRQEDLSLPQFAAVFGLESNANAIQTGDTAWTLTKTANVDTAAKTVTWNIAATKGATTNNRLTVDGYLDVINLGTAPATLGNIVVNIQARQGNQWVTVSSDVADATSGDGATSAHVVGDNTVEGTSTFTENTASGALSFTDRRYNTMFSLVPEQKLQPWTDLPLVFSASYDNNVLHLAQGAQIRFEVVVTFGNHPLGGPRHTDENVDINGNGIIDADEHKVRSIVSLMTKTVPAQQTGNTSLALTDTTADIATQGTVTYGNPVINLGATSGTVKVTYDAGASGGSITNCVHGTGSPTISTTVGGRFTFVEVPQLNLTTCTTAAISQPTCTPGAIGCGWHDGDMESYDQGIWGAKVDIGTQKNVPNSPQATLLINNFDAVFNSDLILGIPIANGGKQMEFDGGREMFLYIPATGPAAALNQNVIDPSSTSAGMFGGQVAALRIDIAFNDAGIIGGSAPVKYGDLRLCGLTATPGLNGSTIRQLDAVANTSLGGGTTGYALSDLNLLVGLTTSAFDSKEPTTFAQEHIFNGACP